MEFEWDPAKDRGNQRTHGFSFDSASELFTGGVDYLEIFDAEHSVDEDRFIAIGPIQRGMIVVVYTEPQEETIRILSVRAATKLEIGRYRAYWEARDE